MKKQTGNICKFVTDRGTSRLNVHNFVYEKNAPAADELRIPRAHALHLIVTGQGRLVTEHAVRPLAAGMLVFTFAGVPARIENGGELEYLYISFSGPRADELFARFAISQAHCILPGFSGLLPFWQDALARGNDENLDLISESVLLYTFSQLSASGESGEARLVGEVLQFIEANFGDPRLSLAAIAAEFGYHPKYLSRVFVQSVGTTFSEYLKTLRLRHAVFLIEQGITSVKNVALLSGYRDPLYFSKVFRQSLGVSPSEFIEQTTGELRSCSNP